VVEYFDKRFKFKLRDYEDELTKNDGNHVASTTKGRGFQRVTGGYKLYAAPDAKDRWYFNLAVELPTTEFKKGEIIYQWITYNFPEKYNALDGAVACKIEVGNIAATSSDQWGSVPNLSNDSNGVKGKKWY
jgi:hypothetical protein